MQDNSGPGYIWHLALADQSPHYHKRRNHLSNQPLLFDPSKRPSTSISALSPCVFCFRHITPAYALIIRSPTKIMVQKDIPHGENGKPQCLVVRLGPRLAGQVPRTGFYWRPSTVSEYKAGKMQKLGRAVLLWTLINSIFRSEMQVQITYALAGQMNAG